jgi:hypothetical protein
MFGRLAPVILAPVIAATLACGSSDEDPIPSDTDGLVQTQTVLAQTKPDLRDGRVFSGALGYSAELPGGWGISATVGIANGNQDTFFAVGTDEFPPTIQVRCVRVTDKSEAVRAAVTETGRAYRNVTLGVPRLVDGQDAISVRFLAGQAPLEVEREDVRFADEACAWSISYITLPGRREDKLSVFERFLNTFNANE